MFISFRGSGAAGATDAADAAVWEAATIVVGACRERDERA